MNKRTLKTAVLFSALVFVILVATMFLNVLFTMAMFRSGILDVQHRESSLIFFAIISVIIGMIISKFVARRPIGSIVEISEATKEIARGNFNVQMNEDIRVTEIQTMARNFNLMVRELAATEILRNDFVENVSHEFKTPLAAIEGYVTLLQRKGLSEEKRKEYTDRILFNTKRLSALTGNILLLSRLENQEIEIKKESYSLDEQLREILLMYEPQWSGKKLDLDIDLDSVICCGNKELLAQVWQNLIGNAIKFVSDKGNIRVLLRQKQNAIVVSVVDNGPGMSKEVMGRIYEKFYQGDTSRASSGNGLGLTLAKRIVDLHGGTISVSSKEGKGTTFTVSLPI
ncbi:ATP-binding protein [Frisingicoccus sp.]|uniref:HAMP domain-containing sensor histidine kinase n=1 Tax=Frisingicoccus sp. TaxID=1918627 RepID=UPI003AB8FADE